MEFQKLFLQKFYLERIFFEFFPDTLITAIPEIPGPDERA